MSWTSADAFGLQARVACAGPDDITVRLGSLVLHLSEREASDLAEALAKAAIRSTRFEDRRIRDAMRRPPQGAWQ